MKKILVSLLVLALCAPAMAATVSFVDNTDGTGTFTITTVGDGDEYMVGLALDVDATADVSAVAISDAAFNIYPDGAYTLELGTGYTYGAGGPVCAKTVPGEITLASSPQDFALCFANLNGSATAGANGAQTIAVTFTVTGGGTVTIGENATRAGVVGTLGENIDLTGDLVGVITDGAGECIAPGHADYDEWALVLKPDSWCNPRQCYGDANAAEEPFGKGTVWVGMDDLNLLLTGFRVAYVNPTTSPWIAADASRSAEPFGKGTVRVGMDDLSILLANFRVGTVGTDCND